MRTWIGRRLLLGLVLTGGALGGAAANAWAQVNLCVPSTAGSSITSNGSSTTCASGTAVALPSSSADQQTLLSILPHINYSASGIDGKPTIKFTGVNVQVINGAGSTSSRNGEGNLVIGYDSSPGTQTGSHNLIIGNDSSDTGYADLIDGFADNAAGNFSVALGSNNAVSGTYSGVLGGYGNNATSNYSSVSGGCSNLAGTGTASPAGPCTNVSNHPHDFASITGGTGNVASGIDSAVSGGNGNTASGGHGSTTGGSANIASGLDSAVSGGDHNTASGGQASISGGESGTASGMGASISGGHAGKSTGHVTAISGGWDNEADQEASNVVAGEDNVASGVDAGILGGDSNSATGSDSSIAGGQANAATDEFGAILGGCLNRTGHETNPNGGTTCPEEDVNTVSGGENNDADGALISILGTAGVTITGPPATSYPSP